MAGPGGMAGSEPDSRKRGFLHPVAIDKIVTVSHLVGNGSDLQYGFRLLNGAITNVLVQVEMGAGFLVADRQPLHGNSDLPSIASAS